MNMNDKELDRLLASATTPRLSSGFNDRLLHELNAENAEPVSAENKVFAFPSRVPAQRTTGWPFILPLLGSMAAALVGGIYLGIETNASSLISTASSVASVDDGDLTGFEDLELFLQDGLS
jgi:hypothetical protein